MNQTFQNITLGRLETGVMVVAPMVNDCPLDVTSLLRGIRCTFFAFGSAFMEGGCGGNWTGLPSRALTGPFNPGKQMMARNQ